MSKGKEVLRWIVMPFAALSVAIVTYAIGAFITGVNIMATEDYSGVRVTSFTKVLTGCGLNFLVWALFVIVAASIAPRGKKIVMIVFSILACVLTILTITYYATSGTEHSAIEYIYLVASLAGATVAPYYVRDEFENKRNKP